MNKITNNNIAISYNSYGKGPVTLLFVHGSFIDQSYWAQQVSFFVEKYRVVTMDLAAHGQSGTERDYWTIEDMADDVVQLIRQLELKNVILVGHSLGADLILIAATQYPGPVIGFIVVDNFKNVATPLPAIYQDQVAGILDSAGKDYAGTNEQYARMALLTADTPQWITDKIVAAYRNSYKPMGLQTLPQFFTMDKIERERLPLLALKVHLINVTYIPTNKEALDLHVTNGYTLTEIEGTSHYPMLETPQELNLALDRTINNILQDK